MSDLYIGVDPGLSGGVAVLDAAGSVEWLRRTPESEREIWELFDSLPYGKAVIEKVGARPDQNAVAVFRFGQIVGFTRACLTAIEVPWEEVAPKVWQKALGIPVVKGEKYYNHKQRLKAVAERLFPSTSITLKTCDAILIAEYLRRKNAK